MFDQTIVTVWSAPNYCYWYVPLFFFLSTVACNTMLTTSYILILLNSMTTSSPFFFTLPLFLSRQSDMPWLSEFLPIKKNSRCGNVASILELDEHLSQEYKVFHHAPMVSQLIPTTVEPLCRFLIKVPNAYHRTGRQICPGKTASRRLLFVVDGIRFDRSNFAYVNYWPSCRFIESNSYHRKRVQCPSLSVLPRDQISNAIPHLETGGVSHL